MKELKENKKNFFGFFPLFEKLFRINSSYSPLSKDFLGAYENLNEPVLIIDNQKNIIWKNKAFQSFFKSSSYEKCYQICGNSSEESCFCLRALATGQIENNFFELNSSDLNQRTFAEMISIPLKGKSSESDKVIVIIKEKNNFTFTSKDIITEEKSPDSKEKEGEQTELNYNFNDEYDLLKHFLINLKGIIYQRDMNLQIVYIEGAFKEITGFDKSEFIGKGRNWNDVVKPEDQGKYYASLENTKKHPNSEVIIDYRIICDNGAEKWIREKMMNVYNSEKNERFIYGFLYDITERKEAEEELNISKEELRSLALYIESSREEERKRIAKDIHDELGHALTALKLELMWLIKKKYLRQEVLYERTRKMNELIESTIRKVRTISSELRPSVLDHFGLVAAIEWQAAEFQKRSAMRCKVVLPNQELNLDEKYSTAIFRIFQEILTNIARHSRATRVDVLLEVTNNELKLRVSDNGKGIKQENINSRKSFGLIGMYERATALGGKLSITGVTGIGTTVTLTIPLK
ncbi:MAG: PAS domain S-box protein [Candidatus Kapabacteria bacterium]|nr:PAS domain S-box protein [Candidatus Kapabacteria bacterium]